MPGAAARHSRADSDTTVASNSGSLPITRRDQAELTPGDPQGPWEPDMGANVFSRPQTQRDSVRMFTQVNGSPFDSVRRRQTSETVLEFPDTEEVTGSNPVRPTPFFENLSSAGIPNGSQAPAVLSNKRWSQG
jgi:hypothetical protein